MTEVRHVAGYEGQIVYSRRRCDKRVHRRHGTSGRFPARDQPSPLIGNRAVNQSSPTFEAHGKLRSKPLVQPTATSTGGQPLNAVPQFRKRHNAEEYFVLVDLLKPLDDTRVGMRLRPFRHNVRVE